MGNTFDDDVFLLSRDEDEEKEAKNALFLFLFATTNAEQMMGKEEVIFACFKSGVLDTENISLHRRSVVKHVKTITTNERTNERFTNSNNNSIA
jgi:hypothetical protein